MTFEFQTIIMLAGGAITLITLAGLVVKGLRTGSGAASLGAKIDKLAAQNEDFAKRLQKMEDDFKHMPDAKSFHKIELAMGSINGKMDVIEERLKPIAGIAERLQEVLLNRGER